MKTVKIIALCAILLAAFSLAAQTRKMTRAEYLERYKHIAVAHMEKYGIPASIKMAQGMLESANGNSRLAVEAGNHFGIKCKGDWTGLTITENDDEPDECFRRYASAEESWADHSEFLDKGPRYQFLFELDPLDYKAWAEGLREAGYATNPLYPELLIKIIEDNQLYLLDRGEQPSLGIIVAREEAREAVSAGAAAPGEIDVDSFTIAMHLVGGREVYRTSLGRFIVAREGDSLPGIASSVGIRARRLARLNGIEENAPLVAGQKIKL